MNWRLQQSTQELTWKYVLPGLYSSALRAPHVIAAELTSCEFHPDHIRVPIAIINLS
jgi:hypothetical protein